MGTTGSSKRKSSSLKKKRSKNSSQVQRRKRSQSRTRRNKSKKLRQRDDSVSYSDDDSRSSSMSISSYTSEDDYKRRRSRSRTQKDVKVSKKRARRSSSSRDSMRESTRVKKRKRSKRNADLDKKKKTHKKPRRDVSISSRSISSRSCTTCSSSEDSEYEKPRGRSERRERDKGKGKAVTKRSRYKSRSSSCSRYSEGYQSEDKLTGENNWRRLKSVITVVKGPEEKEESELDRDGHKEEIIYDHDDYPSCRSNDSNDGGSKREFEYSHVTSEKGRGAEDVKGKKPLFSDIKTSEVADLSEDDGGRYDGSNPISYDLEANNCSKENNHKISDTAKSDDLESILRQKALENLRKHRGGNTIIAKTLADQKEKSHNDVKQSSIAVTESVQNTSLENADRVRSATQVADQISMPETSRNYARPSRNGRYSKTELGATQLGAAKSLQTKSDKGYGARVVSAGQVVDPTNVPRTERNSSFSSQSVESGTGPLAFKPNQVAITDKSKEKDVTTADAIIDKSKLVTSGLRREPSLKEVPTSQASPKVNLLMTNRNIEKGLAETTKTAKTIPLKVSNAIAPEASSCLKPTSISSLRQEPSLRQPLISEASLKAQSLMTKSASESSQSVPEASSSLKPTSVEETTKEVQGEAKEGSQYEQKTMSVMRGGEMVQVSYKVYIPKKTPALARRQLRR